MTDPPLLNILTSPIIKIKGGRTINWIQDLFPEVAVGAGIINDNSILNRTIVKL